MTTQGPPSLNPDTPLTPDTGESNVAVNRRQSEDAGQSNLAGMDIYPNRVFAKEMYLEESLRVGSGVSIGDGSITTDMLAADAVTAGKIDVSTLSAITADMGTLTAGSITGGSINVGDGGVTVSNDDGTSGIYIGANEIYAKYDGTKTFTLDGGSGVVTATSFQMTTDTLSMIRTAASGARVEINNDGLAVFDADGHEHTKVTADGLSLYNSGGGTPALAECITFEDVNGYVESKIYHDHANHDMRLWTDHAADASDVGLGITLTGNLAATANGTTGVVLTAGNADILLNASNGAGDVDVWGDLWAYNLSETATAWTPAFTCAGTMTYTAASPAATGTKANHWHVGPFVFFSLHQGFTLGTVGDPSDEIYFTLPHNVASNDFHAMSGSYFGGTTDQIVNVIYHSTSQFKVMKADESDFAEGTGKTLTIQGWYLPA